MITKNELAQALIESYSPNVYKKPQLTEGSRRNKQSLYGMSQFNLPEPEEETSNSSDSSFSELDVQDIIYEFYVNKRNPTSADIAKLQTVGIWTIPTVDCYWKFFNEAAKYSDYVADIVSQSNSPQALYAHIKKYYSRITSPENVCKSKYMFVSHTGAILLFVGYRGFRYTGLDLDSLGTDRIRQQDWPKRVYPLINRFINGPLWVLASVEKRNNSLQNSSGSWLDRTWVKSWWEDTYGIKFNF